jgi:hypothetical protein
VPQRLMADKSEFEKWVLRGWTFVVVLLRNNLELVARSFWLRRSVGDIVYFSVGRRGSVCSSH